MLENIFVMFYNHSISSKMYGLFCPSIENFDDLAGVADLCVHGRSIVSTSAFVTY